MRVPGQRGQSMVEFALVAPVLFLVLIGMFDMMRMVQINDAATEAARQGARQAVANASATDNPFAASDGQPCSGTAFTSQASGSGCLTDARIYDTVVRVLGTTVSAATLYSDTPATACPLPASGTANVCIAPGQAGSAGAYSACANARSALGREPRAGDLGSRQTEWSNPKYKGCFLVQVTVVTRYSPATPLIGNLLPSTFRIAASTATVAEY